MKIFQILNGICHWDASKQYPSLSDTVGKFPSDLLFVEAPDFVFEGWGYDADLEGDARFIKPTPPDGWLYHDNTGTFYPEDFVYDPISGLFYPKDGAPPSELPSYEDLLSMAQAIERGLKS